MRLPFGAMMSADALNVDTLRLYASLNYTEWNAYKVYR